jgi:uncharacterized cupin superfamily protein
MAITHFDEVRRREIELGHLHAAWSFLGEAAGSVGVGARRIQVQSGGWSTPAHEHGREEEIFFVLAGRGLSWQKGETYEIRPGDCVVYLASGGAHTLHALDELDVLAFGPRLDDESVGFPRSGMSLIGGRAVDSVEGRRDGYPIQFVREVEVGPPELPSEPSTRPAAIVNVEDAEPDTEGHGRFQGAWRDLGRAAGSVTTGLKHVELPPGALSCPQHCHSAEEELFVILDGDGILWLGDDEIPVRAGSVVSRPAGTGVAHAFRAGDGGLTLLAYGTREPNDICYYPRSNKIYFCGVRLIARLEPLDYWDGED